MRYSEHYIKNVRYKSKKNPMDLYDDSKTAQNKLQKIQKIFLGITVAMFTSNARATANTHHNKKRG